MKNPVIRTAHKFIRKTLKGKTDINSITMYLQRKGYAVTMYDNDEEDALILKHDLDSRVKIIHAFTVVENNSRFVYINNALSAENKTYSILHETGHIVLGHLDSEDIVVNERRREMEAEAFAYAVLNPQKQNYLIPALLIILGILLFANLMHTPVAVPTSASVDVKTEYVCVTPSGEKYHRDSCIHVRGKNCTVLPEKEAQKNYEPCLVCNP